MGSVERSKATFRTFVNEQGIWGFFYFYSIALSNDLIFLSLPTISSLNISRV